MADKPLEAIRQSHRYEMIVNRKRLKHEENDLRRSLPDLRLEDVDLSALANKLKTKSEVNARDLRLLKNILIRDEKNITLVLNTQGALRGLVREISGTDVNRQVEAAGCLCNLALADVRGCLTIIRVAGAYLVAALDSHNMELAITCAWTFGNLCGAGVQASKQITTTGAIAKLCAQMKGANERMDAAVYALTQFAHVMGDEMSKEHLDMILKSVASTSCNTAFRLYYILSCHKQYSDPQALIEAQLISRFPDMMKQHHNSCVVSSCCDVLYAIRTLANMDYPVYCNFLKNINEPEERRKDFLDLVKDPRLKVSMLWLYGNMTCKQKRYLNLHHPQVPVDDDDGDEVNDLREIGFDEFAEEEPTLAEMSEDED